MEEFGITDRQRIDIIKRMNKKELVNILIDCQNRLWSVQQINQVILKELCEQKQAFKDLFDRKNVTYNKCPTEAAREVVLKTEFS